MSVPTVLAGRLRRWIEAQRLLPGRRRPSERELATLLAVTRFQARSVLLELERSGLVRTASPRIRVVTEALAPPAFERTVAVIAPLGTSPVPGQESAATLERRVMLGLDQALRAAGLVQLTVPPDADPAHIDELLRRRPFGWIVVAADGPVVQRLLRPPPGVAVCVYEDLQPASILSASAVDRVASGQREGAAQLVRWLRTQGRRRLLYVDEVVEPRRQAQAWRVERRSGCIAACAACGCVLAGEVAIPEPAVVSDDPDLAFATQARIRAGFLAEYLLGPDPVDAILAINDDAVAALHGACRLLGKEPSPGSLMLVGFDNTWRSVPLFGPGELVYMPASVDRDLEGVGSTLVRLLVERAHGVAPLTPRRTSVVPRLVLIPERIRAGTRRSCSFNL
jgi:DNA-binding LacI/PurR family transcriptional regulator